MPRFDCPLCGARHYSNAPRAIVCKCETHFAANLCQYRSEPIGSLNLGCSSCRVYRCNKYSTYCTLVTPAEYGLLILGTEDRLTRENSRACSLCRAAGEDG